MVFSSSTGGVSHAPGEDTPEADLALAIEAFGQLAQRVIAEGVPGMKRVRVTAAGRVQGVFFRRSVADRAESRGLAGWVRNCRDGSVEAVFEGGPDAVDALVGFCREGPAAHRSIAWMSPTRSPRAWVRSRSADPVGRGRGPECPPWKPGPV